jgi:predicted AlkP superfamily pyrophosphatase or phosphodiesterase
MNMKLIIVLLNLLNLIESSSINYEINNKRLLLITLDGFRKDFIYKYKMKNLNLLSNEGIRAKYLKPTFGTHSIPNLWSILTGLYQEDHGIISNHFHDPLLNETFNVKNHRSSHWWNTSESLWHLAVRNNIKTGAYSVPFSRALHLDSKYFHLFDHNYSTPYLPVGEIVRWFLKDDFKFITIHLNQPNLIGHRFGIDSNEFNVTMQNLDISFGELIEQLKKINLFNNDDFTLVILSTHGLVNVRKNIFIDNFIDIKNDARIVSFTSSLIHLQPYSHTNILNLIDKLKMIHDINVYLKETIPSRFHYQHNNRIGQIIILAKEGVSLHLKHLISNSFRKLNLTNDELYELVKETFDKANHGYDNELDSMHGIFIAKSSLFKHNFKFKDSIEAIDVYPLVCLILDIKCNLFINASYQRVEKLLASNNANSSKFNYFINRPLNYYFTFLFCIIFMYF